MNVGTGPPPNPPGFMGYVTPHSRRFREILVISTLVIMLFVWLDYSYNYAEMEKRPIANGGSIGLWRRDIRKDAERLPPKHRHVQPKLESRKQDLDPEDPDMEVDVPGTSYSDGKENHHSAYKLKIKSLDQDHGLRDSTRVPSQKCVCPTQGITKTGIDKGDSDDAVDKEEEPGEVQFKSNVSALVLPKQDKPSKLSLFCWVPNDPKNNIKSTWGRKCDHFLVEPLSAHSGNRVEILKAISNQEHDGLDKAWTLLSCEKNFIFLDNVAKFLQAYPLTTDTVIKVTKSTYFLTPGAVKKVASSKDKCKGLEFDRCILASNIFIQSVKNEAFKPWDLMKIKTGSREKKNGRLTPLLMESVKADEMKVVEFLVYRVIHGNEGSSSPSFEAPQNSAAGLTAIATETPENAQPTPTDLDEPLTVDKTKGGKPVPAPPTSEKDYEDDKDDDNGPSKAELTVDQVRSVREQNSSPTKESRLQQVKKPATIGQPNANIKGKVGSQIVKKATLYKSSESVKKGEDGELTPDDKIEDLAEPLPEPEQDEIKNTDVDVDEEPIIGSKNKTKATVNDDEEPITVGSKSKVKSTVNDDGEPVVGNKSKTKSTVNDNEEPILGSKSKTRLAFDKSPVISSKSKAKSTVKDDDEPIVGSKSKTKSTFGKPPVITSNNGNAKTTIKEDGEHVSSSKSKTKSTINDDEESIVGSKSKTKSTFDDDPVISSKSKTKSTFDDEPVISSKIKTKYTTI